MSISGCLDIDAILAEEERVPCTFRLKAKGLGHLDTNSEEVDVSENQRLGLPLWLANTFNQKKAVVVEAPTHFGAKMREEMKAGAESINLRDFSYYFLEVGLQVSKILVDEDLRRDIRRAFIGERYRNLTVRALTQSSLEDVSEFAQTLTSTEQNIFRGGIRSLMNIQQWRTLESSVLKKALVLGRRDGADHDKARKRTKL